MNNSYPNILLVAGTGRKIGKTSLICKIIEKFKDQVPVIAIKLTPHLHTNSENAILETALYQCPDFRIFKEESNSPKDSGRYFNSGANKVFYIESQPITVVDAFYKTMTFIPLNSIIVCESGSLFDYIKPGAFIMITGKEIKSFDKYFERLGKADIVFDSTNINCCFDISKITIKEGKWKIN